MCRADCRETTSFPSPLCDAPTPSSNFVLDDSGLTLTLNFNRSMAATTVPAGVFITHDLAGKRYTNTSTAVGAGASPVLNVVLAGTSGSPATGLTDFTGSFVWNATNGVPLAAFNNYPTDLAP